MNRETLLHELARRIAAIQLDHPVRVAVDGIDASGKTTLADELAPVLRALGRPVLRASIDRFHNPREIRYRRGPDSPEGYFHDSFDYAALRSLLLDPLGPGGSRACRAGAFDFRGDTALSSAEIAVEPGAVLLFDGVFLLRPELLPCWDYTLFLDVRFDVALERAMKRDVSLFGSAEAVRERYERRYIPGERLYLESCSPRERADALVDNNDPANPLLTLKPVLKWNRLTHEH